MGFTKSTRKTHGRLMMGPLSSPVSMLTRVSVSCQMVAEYKMTINYIFRSLTTRGFRDPWILPPTMGVWQVAMGEQARRQARSSSAED